ncbi:hypothetical protein RJ44_02010 [Alteromonas macleodii]|uniref:hypothetical protein n=1 Tax=Alteromonas macleodii TaxID=28108 RepID=UPI00057C614E|nr:hypothetical protein [Alteromonas macleodii]KHT61021.1 hypothetical protein RJ44_02010 [Alteromonas macleodii]
MSRWKEQFHNHAIHQTLDKLQEWLSVELNDLNSGDVAELRRCRGVVDLISSTIFELDPELIPFQQLDDLNNQLRNQNVWNQVHAFSSNKQIQHVVTANNHLSNVIRHLTWMLPYTNVNGRNEDLSSLRSAVDQSLNALSNKKDELRNELSELSNKVQELSRQKERLETTIEQRRQEVDQQVSQWQQQFSDAQEKRTGSYNDWRMKVEAEVKQETQALVEATQSEVDSLDKNTKAEISQILKNSKDKHQEIKELFLLASGDSISGGYSKFADKERLQSNIWRGIAVFFICLTAWWILSAYEGIKPTTSNETVTTLEPIDLGNDSRASETETAGDRPQVVKTNPILFDWQRFLLSFSLTGVLLFGAGYAGQQSNRHRESESRMRWFALQIKALDPYINSLDSEDQKELKKALSEKFFNGAHDTEAARGMVDEHAVSVVAKAITDAIKAAKS